MPSDEAAAGGRARPGVVSRAATLLATGFGSGYSPIAPGTAGSAVGLLLFWPIAALGTPALLACVGAGCLLAVWSADHVARRTGIKDPSLVVADEIVGMWLSLLFLPFTPATALLGFFLFRVMDVFKPYPARQLESLPGGLGIVADDLMAGVYANLSLRVVALVLPLS